MLREEGEVKKRLLAAQTNQALFEQLNRDMERRITSLVNLIEALPETENPGNLTAYITLCLCHIKRRCNLFFLARQGEPLSGDELGMYLDELAELGRYGGLKTLLRCGQIGILEIRSAALCYDFAFETISWTLREEASPLMGYLEKREASWRSVSPRRRFQTVEVLPGTDGFGGRLGGKCLERSGRRLRICLSSLGR